MTKELLEKKINEYNKLEKYFGTDKSGAIIYNERLDQELALNNLEKNYPYSGFYDFLNWIDGKTKSELMTDLMNFNEKNDEEKHKKIIYPSGEQKAIINCITENKNCVVDAVAGSGKTTTVMFIAQENSKKKILQVTYNKELKLEVREKVESAKITNLDIHTYHSLAVRFYDKNCYTDDKIIKVLSNNSTPKVIIKYDIIIVDEVQDMTPNYYSLICKFINDMKMDNSTMLILGDRYQGVYDFKNADTRFLTFSDKIMSKNNNFVKLPMQESYRVTKQIAWFVNKVMLGQDRIVSNKDSKHRVYYYRKNRFAVFSIFAQKILQLIKEGYKPSDFFILAPSLKSVSPNNPIKKLENKLVDMKIPVYFSRNDEEGLNRDIIKGKVVFTTFHQSKGRERKICIVFGFDSSYFMYYNKNKNPTECPSELYVAITRASEILMIFEGDDEKPLEFLKLDHAQMRNSGIVDFQGNYPKEKKERVKPNDDIHKTTVSELTSYVSEENNEKLMNILNIIFKTESDPISKYTIDMPSSIKTDSGKTEDVSDINGLAIPAMFEHKKTGVSKLQIMIKEMYDESSKPIQKLINEVLNNKIEKGNSIGKFLCMGNLYIALSENIHSKLSQIDKYKWLTEDMVKICSKNLKNNVGKDPEFEMSLGNNIRDNNIRFFKYVTNAYGELEINCRVDCVDSKTLWEFKCVSEISNEHLLQLVVYAWIWEKSMKEQFGKKKFKLLNIRTGEIQVLKYDNFHAEEIISILLSNKYYVKPKDNDKDFIERCNKIRDKIKKSVNKPIEKNLFDFGTFSDLKSNNSNNSENSKFDNSEEDNNVDFRSFFDDVKPNTKKITKTVKQTLSDSENEKIDKPKKSSKKITKVIKQNSSDSENEKPKKSTKESSKKK